MLDVNGTREVEAGGRKWAIRPLPFAVILERQMREREADSALRRVSKIDGDRVVPLLDTPECGAAFDAAVARRATESVRGLGEALRWGLRAYADEKRGEDVVVDGRKYRVLNLDAVAVLVSWGGEVMDRLASEIVRSNTVTADDLLGFLPPSGS